MRARRTVKERDIVKILVFGSNEARGWCGSYTNYGKRID